MNQMNNGISSPQDAKHVAGARDVAFDELNFTCDIVDALSLGVQFVKDAYRMPILDQLATDMAAKETAAAQHYCESEFSLCAVTFGLPKHNNLFSQSQRKGSLSIRSHTTKRV